MNTEPIALPDGNEVLWKTSEENNILLETDGYGLKTSYDGTGYVIKIPYSTKRSDYIQYINKLFTDSTFFDKYHLNVFIGTVAFYIPSHDWLISISLLIEFDSSGNILAASIISPTSGSCWFNQTNVPLGPQLTPSCKIPHQIKAKVFL